MTSENYIPPVPVHREEEPFVIRQRSFEFKMAFLRIQLWSAMQMLEGEELEEFWKMIDELQACRKPERRTT
jgi:hypothetical protein